ncbi:YlmH/Sll1252 family protein [Fusobacterium simiae]|uniref:YlmH/Sll1252 family protein n=2 Tax=Fusobacterium simiae TaxID=855 RepID=A0ABT4DL49_FUSSI|nr:YlmH/Sll1252 family protein [Fusobacterium simiae]MCY7008241.1 YlmH/Sll1252 family protein [Fusobacterium simiae]
MNENLEKIENYIKLAEKTDTIIYSNQFFPVSQLNNLKYSGIKFSFKGLNEDCEKKLLATYPEYFSEEYIHFPVKYFKIIKKSKFITLEHKHYLGNIIALGIKREILGDLIVKNDECYGIILENMFDFLKENLLRINSSPVEIIEIKEDEVPQNEFKELNVILSSLRLDSLVSELTNLSRSSSVNYIDLGNVQVNYEIQREKNYRISIGDTVIIKKYGKFKIEEENGLTKKDKVKLIVRKYI